MKFLNFFYKRKLSFRFSLYEADFCPDDFINQLPILIQVIRKIPGSDRPDYWIAKSETPIFWKDRNMTINYVIVANYFYGEKLDKNVKSIVLNVAFVVDESVINDKTLDFNKSFPIAICRAKKT